MSKWIAAELHSHTFHSDGNQTLLTLAETGKTLGINAVAITDHNTISSYNEINDVYEKTGVFIIKGVEYTTFYGHFLNLGINSFTNWAKLHKNNLNSFISEIREKEKDSIFGIAHPFRIGSPICTGCHFDYENIDYNNIDYLEIWSREFPSVKSYENQPCMEYWDNLLNKGYKISGTSGRDWHSPNTAPELPICRTFLQIEEEPTIENISKLATIAIKTGNSCVSMGHCIVVKKEEDCINISLLSLGLNSYFDKYSIKNLVIKINSNLGYIHEENIDENKNIIYKNNNENALKWVRVELFGNISGVDAMIGFANPLYY